MQSTTKHVPTEFVAIMPHAWGRGFTLQCAIRAALANAANFRSLNAVRVALDKWDIDGMGTVSWETDHHTKAPIGQVKEPLTDEVMNLMTNAVADSRRAAQAIKEMLKPTGEHLRRLDQLIDEMYGIEDRLDELAYDMRADDEGDV